MSKNILYIGNKLSAKNRNVTTVETLSKKLRDLSYVVKSYSNQDNKVLRLISILWAILRHRHFNYVLIDTYSTNAFWFAWFSAKLCQAFNIPYIMFLHGGNLPERLKSHSQYAKDIFRKAVLNICPSAYLYETFRNEGFTNLKIIPNSLDIENYTFKQRQHIKPKLLWVRAFADIYNPILALKVLKKLIKTYPNAQLSMVGPFKDKTIDECREYANKYDLPVKFTGRLSKEEWIKYAIEFDIFINTTNVDNTPVSVIEAMALGLPIVSTNIGGLPYLLHHKKNALLVKPNDEKAMQKAIENLIEKKNLANELSLNGRQLAKTFGWDIVKAEWQKVLK